MFLWCFLLYLSPSFSFHVNLLGFHVVYWNTRLRISDWCPLSRRSGDSDSHRLIKPSSLLSRLFAIWVIWHHDAPIVLMLPSPACSQAQLIKYQRSPSNAFNIHPLISLTITWPMSNFGANLHHHTVSTQISFLWSPCGTRRTEVKNL